MPRSFAVAGFTAFFTVAVLSSSETGVMIYALIAYIIALVVALLIKELRNGKVFPFSMACGAMSCVLLICFNVFVYEPVIAYDGKTAQITARLTSSPQERYGNTYYQAQTVTVNGVETDINLRLSFNRKPDAQPYDLIEGIFTFYRPGFTADEYLESNKANGNYIAAYALGDVKVCSVQESEKPFSYKIEKLRQELKKAVYRVLPDDNGAVAIALLLGDKNGISDGIQSDFKKAGITHIICVSGFHLSLWANFILVFLRKLKLNLKISSLFAMTGVVFFMLLTGMTPSVLRSGIMMLIFLAGNLFSRKSDSLNSLGFALFAIALYNPMILTGLSLKLSAMSTLGIIIYNETYSEKVKTICLKIKDKLLASSAEKLLGSLAVTAAAVAFIQPVTLQMQGNFNFFVFFSNLLVIFVAGVAIVFSALAALSGLLIPLNANPFVFISKALIQYVILVARMFSECSHMTFYVDDSAAYFIIGFILLIACIAVYASFWRKIKPAICIALCAVIFTASVVASSSKIYGETRFNVLDVGNATAVMLMHKGTRILFGCGGTLFNAETSINGCIERYGDKIDALIIPDDSEKSSLYAIDLIKTYQPSLIQADILPREATVLNLSGNTVPLDKTIVFGEVTVNNIFIGNSLCSAVETPDATALICYDPVENFALIPPEYSDVDLLVVRGDYPLSAEKGGYDFIALNAENFRGVLIQNELESKGINCAATAECGDIIICFKSGKVRAFRS